MISGLRRSDSLTDWISVTQREAQNLPNFAYLAPAYLAKGTRFYAFIIIISAV
jgi:hypothetical protein